jgi:hypothetical protein
MQRVNQAKSLEYLPDFEASAARSDGRREKEIGRPSLPSEKLSKQCFLQEKRLYN